MNILIAGNSQAGCLKRALDSSSEDRYLRLQNADWLVVPGGYGPNLKLNCDQIEVTSFDPRFPPRYHPSIQMMENSVNHYDVIVVSALGYTDGGFFYDNPITSDVSVHHASLRLRKKIINSVPISRACFYEIASNKFCPGMPGFNFLRQLRSVFRGKVIVQPFPLLSEQIRDRTDWSLAKIYDNPDAANKLMLNIKDEFLANICSELQCTLLPYPSLEWRSIGFTPAEYIKPSDCLHPTDSYGALVLAQIENIL